MCKVLNRSLVYPPPSHGPARAQTILDGPMQDGTAPKHDTITRLSCTNTRVKGNSRRRGSRYTCPKKHCKTHSLIRVATTTTTSSCRLTVLLVVRTRHRHFTLETEGRAQGAPVHVAKPPAPLSPLLQPPCGGRRCQRRRRPAAAAATPPAGIGLGLCPPPRRLDHGCSGRSVCCCRFRPSSLPDRQASTRRRMLTTDLGQNDSLSGPCCSLARRRRRTQPTRRA